MALEHVLLVSLSERAASGADLTRRFDRSIGFFWTATHQQIYRVLGRMERDGWVTSEVVPQGPPRDKKVYDVTDAGRAELRRWIAEPTTTRPAAVGPGGEVPCRVVRRPRAVLGSPGTKLAEHTKRLVALRADREPRLPRHPPALAGHDLDQYLVLRGGVLMEQFWIDWLSEYLERHAR